MVRCSLYFLSVLRRSPMSSLFPYTTLFRSLSLVEPLFWVLGPQATVYDRLGIVQTRNGNRTPFSAPRNLYRTTDGKWIARSEEHTSELQSHHDLVCRLLLEKQKRKARIRVH